MEYSGVVRSSIDFDWSQTVDDHLSPHVPQAAKRLEEKMELMRIARGVYVRPVETRFSTRAPAPKKVVANIAISHAETVANHGAAAANALGLTTQVPTKLVYLTSGRSRALHLGARVVEMKHAPQWILLPAHRAATEAVRALEWIGQRGAPEGLKVLKRTLPPSTVQELVAVRPALPLMDVRIHQSGVLRRMKAETII